MTNLSNFEEDPKVMKEGMTEDNEYKRDKLALTVQMPINSNFINKKTFSKEDGMPDMDEETSNKKIKMCPQNELTISEELFSEDLKKMVLFQKKVCANATIFFWR